MSETITVWFHSTCSKCRKLQALLEEAGRPFESRFYRDQPPEPAEVEELLGMLGMRDPIELMRKKEAAFSELGIEGLDREGRLEALRTHPELLERPIIVWSGRAVVARPPEKGLELLDS